MTRDERIEANLDLCRLHAVWTYRRIRGRIPLDDLVQYGMVGLVQASDRFDESRGLRFRTLASHKVRGAILDGIRAETKCRSQKAHVPQPLSFDTMRRDRRDVQVDPAPLPDVLADLACVWRLLASLPERTQRIIRLYYGDEDLTDSEIAARLGLSPGRVAQIRLAALKELRRPAGNCDHR